MTAPDTDTIVAIATAPGAGGVGVVRLSGPRSRAIAERLCGTELVPRHAPWIGWITNLSARDPYFILPVLNVAIMWATQRLTPMAGMDPTQQKMMQLMPVVIGVTMIFFPAGLVLYWVTNGALGLLQQWWMTKRHGGDALPAKT